MHNTGEGGLSPHHRQGGDIVLQIGTAYFGCRDEDGNFSLDKLKEVVDSAPVQGDRDQALAGRQARPGRAAAGGQGDQGDLRDPRHPDGPGLRQPVAAHRVQRRGQPARLRRAARRRDRPAGRHQERRRRDGLLARADPADGPGRPWRRLRDHRRRRGRHRRLAADLRRLDRAALPDGLLPGLRHLRRGRADRRRDLHRLRQARPARERRGRVRAGRRHGQRGPRGDDVDRLHPVAEVPHRPVPDRRRHPGPVARPTASTRPRRPSGARSTSGPSARS